MQDHVSPPPNNVGEMEPEHEAPEARFRRIANRRLDAAVKAIQSMHALHGTNYAYTPEQVEIIRDVLAEEVETLVEVLTKREPAKLTYL